ncbi:MAG: hypothetical protein KKE39_10155 [Bacteroidetes bacterium]|nr:hypothetical protein [Bacteroidota bacterium]MBU1372839.1 hypothetical protein [Bacteroidota bacterium]MBU1485568.1 hypothetical protein [Bacteroidota bacterium]MBU1760845.1 hypothetical protein [Bacteroidota bacterium]MBU2045476.1 hypothetical protein [Bacteroidota bacterium]
MENRNEMDKDTLELVLQEFAEEQKATNQNINNLIKRTNQLQEEFKKFETQIKKPNPVNVNTDTKPFLQLLQKGMMDIKLMIGNQPKSIQRKFQILLFPEQDAKLFYKIVFGRWFLWLVIMLALTNLYKWSVNYSNNQKLIEMKQVENDRIRKSWKYLYDHSDKNIQSKMEKAYKDSGNSDI